MKYLILLFLLTSCKGEEFDNTTDYMFTLPDGTYVCDNYYTCHPSNFDYCDCEHVLTGRKITRIKISENVSVMHVPEGTK
jgi:hypothetical protein